MGPMNLRDTNHFPGAKVLPETIRVATFLDVVDLLEDRAVELAQHAFPVSVLVRLWKETIHQLHEPIQDCDVKTQNRLEIGTLNLDGNFMIRVQSRTVHLAQRSRGNRFRID